MDSEAAWALLARERCAFADLLDTLSPQQWEHPSLCDAWTVREVATHMMVGPTGSFGGFLTAMVRARGRFAAANQVLVDRRSGRPTAAIAEDFRTHADDRFAPPTMDWRAPLSDFCVHRLDVIVPLGLPDDRPLDPWPEVLAHLFGPKAQMGFMDAGVPALTYRATDVDFVHGSGPEVDGPATALVLALTRRPHELDRLTGDGADALRDWARGR